ncbi:MAG: ATP-binding protein, partial [Clostridiales bacterium]|nr:ATP-binding protein [Clostridiales bacterium]
LHLKKISQPDESERDFIVRLQQESREARDEAIEKLRDSYGKKAATLEERIRKAEQAVQREKDQARDAGIQTAVSLGSTLLSALMGRKKVSTSSVGKAVTTARSVSRQTKQKGDVTRSRETVEAYQEQLAELEKALQTDIDGITDKLDAKAEDVTAYEVKPLKRDCVVKALSLTWEPLRRESDGSLTKSW